jgi:hypothetical protein
MYKHGLLVFLGVLASPADHGLATDHVNFGTYQQSVEFYET